MQAVNLYEVNTHLVQTERLIGMYLCVHLLLSIETCIYIIIFISVADSTIVLISKTIVLRTRNIINYACMYISDLFTCIYIYICT